MNLKKFHTVLKNAFTNSLTILKIILLSKWGTKPAQKIKTGTECIVLGNGPSLTQTIENNKDFFNNKPKLAVNFFVNTDFFLITKPNYYVIQAPELWETNVNEDYIIRGQKLFSDIAQQTQWPMILFLPFSAQKFKPWQQTIKTNSNITVQLYNSTPGDGSKGFQTYIFRHAWAMPRPHNVIIPSLMVLLNLGIETIYIAGADHSWLKEIYVADDNRVFLTQKHFYDSQIASAMPMFLAGRNERKLHEILEKFMLSFKAYFEIKYYAQTRHQRIFNITPNSFIDAFERIKL